MQKRKQIKKKEGLDNIRIFTLFAKMVLYLKTKNMIEV